MQQQDDTSVHGLSTLRIQLAQQKERMKKFQHALQSNLAEAHGEIIQSRRLLEEIKETKAAIKEDVGSLHQEIDNGEKAHKDLREEMERGKVILNNLGEKLREETVELELCAYENQLVLRTLQIDITPASISVPIPHKVASTQKSSSISQIQ